MKRTLLLAVLAISAFAIVMATATPSQAVHAGSGTLVCGQCHTMHSSQGGTYGPSMGGATGSELLLRVSGGNIHELCLTCHSAAGDNASVLYTSYNSKSYTPPKVWNESQAWVEGTDFNTGIGAGGDFFNTGSVTGSGVVTLDADGDSSAYGYRLGYGHSIGATTVVPPGGETDGAIDTLTCTNCHDPHGALDQDGTGTGTINVFRMLKIEAVGGGGGTTADGGGGVYFEDGTSESTIVSQFGAASQAADGGYGVDFEGLFSAASNHVWPVYYSGSHNVYQSDNDGDVDADGAEGMSSWCSQCHDDWHEENLVSGNMGSDWLRHPVDCDLTLDATDGCMAAGESSNGVDITDWNHYSVTVQLADGKLPMAQNTAAAIAPGDFTGLANNVYYGDDATDRVMCLSCHFAHAGPYYDALRWDYTSAVFSGSQTANGLASNVGCQQCHNRGK